MLESSRSGMSKGLHVRGGSEKNDGEEHEYEKNHVL